MTKQSQVESDLLGFITVRKQCELGYFGGLLVLNPLGRPCEFHCTLPHRPNRAQEILYGGSFESYLCGEQIARVLVARTKKSPIMIFTDSQSVLSLRHVLDRSVFGIPDVPFEETPQLKRPFSQESDVIPGKLSNASVLCLANYSSDLATAAKHWERLQPRFDLDEPFGRIHEALMEAHPASRAA